MVIANATYTSQALVKPDAHRLTAPKKNWPSDPEVHKPPNKKSNDLCLEWIMNIKALDAAEFTSDVAPYFGK